MIHRDVFDSIKKNLNKNKAILVLGPRQTGKTTLLKQLKKEINGKVLSFNGDNSDVQEIFEKVNLNEIKMMLGKHKYVFFDEAQRIKNIGLVVKLIVDNISDVQVIVTGSSSIGITDDVNEPLTGRKFEYRLLPFSFSELSNHTNLFEEKSMLEQRIIYGYYPEVVTLYEDRINLIKELTDSYLYKDIYTYQNIKKSHVIVKLLRAIALQIGSQVSYNELSKLVGLDANTVEKYIDVLEKSFVVFRLPAYSRNYRKELKKSKKIFFYDNGIRNSLISNFNSLSYRADAGALWENFFISERMKYLSYNKFYGSSYFWRTLEQQEIDYIEEVDDKISAFEIKLKLRKKVKFPNKFIENYPNSKFEVITPDNFYKYLINY